MTTILETFFSRACQALSLDEQFVDPFYDELVQLYTHPQRAYHNLDHIHSVLERGLEIWDGSEEAYSLFKLAAAYHDAVYVPGSSLNEQLSAELAKSRLTFLGLDDVSIRAITEAIEDTQNHKNPRSYIGKALCDADLFELGTHKYMGNGYKVWLEFGEPEFEAWKTGRLKFIESYLYRPNLYALPGQESLERTARDHLYSEKQYLLAYNR